FASVLQFLWSLPLACLDIFSLRNEKDLHAPDRLLLIVIIDWDFIWRPVGAGRPAEFWWVNVRPSDPRHKTVVI
uniref:Uncharacterized protein n=1 Tax=Aegilops tauschii subsp. strangulata TaxID=200361 RepID=A0A453D2K6_AEGTS